jgi:hypothetical protein
MTAIKKVYSGLSLSPFRPTPGRIVVERGENRVPMRLRRRTRTRRLDELARLMVELDRASTDRRFRPRSAASGRVSSLRLSA